MSDLVVTCPQGFFTKWIEEGDAAGEPYTGEEWAWYIGGVSFRPPPINAGDRLYVVACGRLRGYAPVTRVVQGEHGWAICRRGGAVAITIPDPIKGFRGYRHPWWERTLEIPFPNWRVP